MERMNKHRSRESRKISTSKHSIYKVYLRGVGIYGHKSTISKQEKVSTSTSAGKYLICELQPK
jgi:hypothetical protein